MCSTFLKLLLKFLIIVIVLTALIAFLPGIPPNIPFEPYTVTPSLDLEKLPRANVLDKAEVILQGKITGPESIAAIGKGDGFYSGLENGQIIKYENGKLSVIAQTGKECEGPWEGHICGRPLGMRVDASGKLIVADAYYGLLSVDPKTGKIQPLFDYKQKIGGRVPLFADDLDVDKNGIIYWSDASTTNNYANQFIELIGNTPTGRLIKFDPKTKKNTVLIDGIHFANGVQLSKDEDFVLICETKTSRVLRYYLKGPKTGQKDVFLDGLPGLPDNIRSNGKGGFYVALVTQRQEIIDLLGPIPIVRKIAARFRQLLVETVSLVESVVSKNPVIGEIKLLVSLEKPPGFLLGPSRVVEVDGNGKILRVLEHSQGQIQGATQFSVSEKYAYIGNIYADNVWRIKRSELA